MTPVNTYDPGMGALASDNGCSDQLNFLNIRIFPKNVTKAAEYESQARRDFPYPPKDCDEAISSRDAIAAKIATLNENIASAIDIKGNQDKIDALQRVKTSFDVYINKANCIKQAMASDDAAFNQQWQSLLNNEQSAESGKSNTDTWLVIGGIAVLLIGAVVIMLKKKKA